MASRRSTGQSYREYKGSNINWEEREPPKKEITDHYTKDEKASYFQGKLDAKNLEIKEKLEGLWKRFHYIPEKDYVEAVFPAATSNPDYNKGIQAFRLLGITIGAGEPTHTCTVTKEVRNVGKKKDTYLRMTAQRFVALSERIGSDPASVIPEDRVKELRAEIDSTPKDKLR